MPPSDGLAFHDGRIYVTAIEDGAVVRYDPVSRTTEVVAEAEDGTTAVDAFRSTRPDVSVLDYRMPGLDGLEAATQILAEDPDGIVAPYLMSGGTDAKHFRKLGMRSYGFAPLRLPADLDFTALFHGVDERVPVDALEFGARVMDRFLDEV